MFGLVSLVSALAAPSSATHTFAGGVRRIEHPVVDGLAVYGARRVVALDPRGAHRWTTGPDVPARTWTGDTDPTPVVSRVRPVFGRGALGPERRERGWWWGGEDLVPVWVVDLSTAEPPATWRLYVDARDGHVTRWDRTSREAEGNVYPSNPALSDLTRAELPNLVSDAALVGTQVTTASCDVWQLSDSLLGPTLCEASSTHARPDRDGNYLFAPDPGGLDDPLAEVQTYFHVDRMSTWLDARFGLRLPYAPIRANVNFPWSNAFFGDFDGDGFPDVSFGHDAESGVDLGYDGDVVYHELGHAVVAELAPDLPFLRGDAWGLDWAPGAVNEGAADVWAMLLTGDPRVGEYAGAAFRGEAIRDLSRPRRCPDALHGEVHADGQILGAFGWALIDDPRVGPEVVAELLYGAIPLWDTETDWPTVGRSFRITADDLLAADAIGDEVHTVVLEALETSGMEDCGRVIPLDDGAAPELALLTGGFQGDLERLPAGVQLSIDVPRDAVAVEVRLDGFAAEPGMGWALHGRSGENVGHAWTEIALLGLGFSVPTTWDWVVAGAAPTSTVTLVPGGEPPLVPGTLFLSLASDNLGTLPPYDLSFGRVTISAAVARPVHDPGGCGCGGRWGSGWAAVLLASLAGFRRRS